ncbi:hypothetical protein EMEDMD4_270249 [Sinorhizobium medicae]|uniref:Uncharacterized protein n=1 Tax=Sinorhizobium medicae TaxID=110321 RepID=A0A508X0I8_9HYPH|nr:hypothetical protein EMEDMD4_270249 [Sinorhizobium medicae]
MTWPEYGTSAKLPSEFVNCRDVIRHAPTMDALLSCARAGPETARAKANIANWSSVFMCILGLLKKCYVSDSIE